MAYLDDAAHSPMDIECRSRTHLGGSTVDGYVAGIFIPEHP
jgi:hypothetical protein